MTYEGLFSYNPCEFMIEAKERNNFQLLPFSEATKIVLELAKKNAILRHDNFVLSIDLLSALTQDINVKYLLMLLSITPETMPPLVKDIGSNDDSAPHGNLGFSPRLNRVIELADKEARTANKNEIRPADLFLGIILDTTSIPAEIPGDHRLCIDTDKLYFLRSVSRDLRED